eukprot:1150903-Pelagomonas_calceolata.AAC.9
MYRDVYYMSTVKQQTLNTAAEQEEGCTHRVPYPCDSREPHRRDESEHKDSHALKEEAYSEFPRVQQLHPKNARAGVLHAYKHINKFNYLSQANILY